MTDLELTERCAKWLGLDIVWDNGCDEPDRDNYWPPGFYPIGGGDIVSFDPLYNWNDLMTKVVPKLPSEYDVRIYPPDHYHIFKDDEFKECDELKWLPRAILELIAEMEGK
jgi:hypothetical protein